MEFNEVVRKRRMVRNFENKPVPEDALNRILDLARRSPSAGFTQGQDFVVVTEQKTKDAIAELCNESHYAPDKRSPSSLKRGRRLRREVIHREWW